VELAHPEISLGRQCELLGLARSILYYQERGESERNLKLLRLLDEQYTRTPFYGVPRMIAWLGTQGESVNEKRVRRLLRVLGLEAIYPKPRLSDAAFFVFFFFFLDIKILFLEVYVKRLNQNYCTRALPCNSKLSEDLLAKLIKVARNRTRQQLLARSHIRRCDQSRRQFIISRYTKYFLTSISRSAK